MAHESEKGRLITIYSDMLCQLRELEDASFKPRAFKAEFTDYLSVHPDNRKYHPCLHVLECSTKRHFTIQSG